MRQGKQKSPKSNKVQMPDLVGLKGIIIDRALANFNMLPEAAKRYTDLEDWISAGMLFVAGDLSRRMSKSYSEEKGATQKTFIYRAVDNFYKNSLAFVTNKKRGGNIVSWEDLVGAGTVGQEDHAASQFVDKIDALAKVQSMHRRASIELVIYLDQHFFSQDHRGRVVLRGQVFEKRKQEFRELAKRFDVSIDDYRTAIKIYHELKRSPR